MKLSSVTLHNFRSYYDTHTLKLDTDDEGGLIVLFGDNMSGKTGIFLAINWCLFGQAFGRRGEQIPIFLPGDRDNNYLINSKAIELEDYRVHVRLEWEHDGELWVLDRESKCEGDPLTDSAFTPSVNLQIGQRVVYIQEIPKVINQVIHQRAAQFYFFDGELLSQYERWLENPDERETRVKRAIELTVGTAALRLHEEMDRVALDAENEQRKLVKRANRETKLLGELEERESHQRDLQREIEEYKSHIEDQQNAAEQIERVHGALADYAEHLGRIGELERNVDHEKSRQRDAELEIQELIRKCYWMALTDSNELLRNSLVEDIRKLAEGSVGAIRHGLLRSSLEAGECNLCGVEFNPESEARIYDELTDMGDNAYEVFDIDSLGQLFARLAETERFDTRGQLDRLELLEEKRMEARAEADAYADEVAEIREQYSDRPRGDHETEMDRLRKIYDDIANTKSVLLQAEEDIAFVNEDIASLRTKINRIVIDLSVLRKAEAARLAERSTRFALGEFREIARKNVEHHASLAFTKLVDQPGYEGISIDSDYMVFPVDEEGAIMPIPSAGGQQLLTLALVGGLNGAAVHDAPIIMDTPAGRIDRVNRRRILRWLDGLGQQVVLMVHSGEFVPQEIVDSGVKVARAFQIDKTGGATSEIQEMQLG